MENTIFLTQGKHQFVLSRHSRVFLQAGRSASQWGFGINQLKLSPVEHRYYPNIVKIVIIAITRIWFVILKYQDSQNL